MELLRPTGGRGSGRAVDALASHAGLFHFYCLALRLRSGLQRMPYCRVQARADVAFDSALPPAPSVCWRWIQSCVGGRWGHAQSPCAGQGSLLRSHAESGSKRALALDKSARWRRLRMCADNRGVRWPALVWARCSGGFVHALARLWACAGDECRQA